MKYYPKSQIAKPTRSDIIKYEICGGDSELFGKLENINIDINNIVGGSSLLEEDIVSSIESFFESYDSKNALMKSKVADVNKWKNITSYDEFLQIPLLKEGKDFMNKFLNIQDTISAGGDVSVEDLENLIPEYMIAGSSILGGRTVKGDSLTLLNIVDPEYKPSSYVYPANISDLAKDMINRAFLYTLENIRRTTLYDLKAVLNSINRVVKILTKPSFNRIVENKVPAINVDGGKKK
jgi:hypothetical protein